MNARVVGWSALVVGLSVAAGVAEELDGVVQILQQRLNERATVSLFGPVDYEFVYAVPEAPQVVLLETPPAAGPVAADTARTQPAVVPSRVWIDTLTSAAGQDCLVVRGEEEVPWSAPVTMVQANPRDSLPAELRAADVAVLKQRMPQPVEPEPPPDQAYRPRPVLYLGVMPSTLDARYGAERVSLAEGELTLLERRILYRAYRDLWAAWPGGSYLFLTPVAREETGNRATITVAWAFRRPSGPVEGETLVSGQAALAFQRAAGEWKVSHLERLVTELRGAVATK